MWDLAKPGVISGKIGKLNKSRKSMCPLNIARFCGIYDPHTMHGGLEVNSPAHNPTHPAK